MEDEDDAQSSPLTTPVAVISAAPAHSQTNGRIAATAHPVTVAAPPQHTLTLALPIQQPRVMGAGGGGGGGREDCWSEGATSTLIEAWGERFLELSRGNLKQQHWQAVADIVSAREDYTKTPKTDVQCKNRIDTLKKKYKLEKSKIPTGASPSKWPFFQRLDLLVGPNHHNKPTPPPLPHHPRAAANNHNSSKQLAFGIPVGVRSFHNFQLKHQKKSQSQSQRSPSVSSKSPPLSPDSSDSFPPETKVNGKKRRFGRDQPPVPMGVVQKRRKGGVEGLRELTRAILKFGEVYERVESSKVQQVVEMEKQRMGFVKELELQRMQFFMKTQMELTQLKHHGKVGGKNNSSDNNSNNTD